jgi:cell division protein FtsN
LIILKSSASAIDADSAVKITTVRIPTAVNVAAIVFLILKHNKTPTDGTNQERQMPNKIVNVRLRPDQEERINAIVERSAILDTSKFVRIAVDWLLRSDIGEVIKEIVHDEEHFPDYRIPKKPTGRKKRRATKKQ